MVILSSRKQLIITCQLIEDSSRGVLSIKVIRNSINSIVNNIILLRKISIMVLFSSNFLIFMSSNMSSTKKIWSRLKEKFKNQNISSGKVGNFTNISYKDIIVHHLRAGNMKSETDLLNPNMNNKKISYLRHIISHNNINHLSREHLFHPMCLEKI